MRLVFYGIAVSRHGISTQFLIKYLRAGWVFSKAPLEEMTFGLVFHNQLEAGKNCYRDSDRESTHQA